MSSIQHLARIPLFAALSPNDLALIAQNLRGKVIPAGTSIVRRDDPGDALYIIISGLVKVHTTTASGSEVILALLQDDDFFGEMSAIDGAPRSADVTSLEETKVLILQADGFKKTVETSKTFAWTLLQAMAKRLRSQNDAVESLATRDVVGRVAELLGRLGKYHGTQYTALGVKPAPKSTDKTPEIPLLIEVHLTQADIAAFVGATRERVSQTMSMLRAGGLVAKEPISGRIVIVKPSKLADIVTGH